MKIIVNIWNEEKKKWDEEEAEIIRVTKTQLIVELNEDTLRFNRKSGLLHGIIHNNDEPTPNHTAPFIDMIELDRTRNLVLTNKPLYRCL